MLHDIIADRTRIAWIHNPRMHIIAQQPHIVVIEYRNRYELIHIDLKMNTEHTHSWQGVAGCYVTAWTQSVLDVWVADAFGFYAAQLGQNQRIHALQHNRCSERWAVELGEAHHHGQDRHEIMRVDVGDFTVLPFASDSMDLLVLPHTLENHPDPHAVLREAYRVLRPEGKMIITGFNPFSLWGCKAMARRWLGKKWWAYEQETLHVGRLKDWLKLFNCDIVQGKFGCYAPFVKSEPWLRRWSWLEKAGDRWWGMAGGVYAIMAVKKIYSPTLVGLINEKKNAPKWVAQPALSVEPVDKMVTQKKT